MHFLEQLDTNKHWQWSLAIIAGLIAVTLPILGYFSYIPGDLGDTRLNIYFLEHAYRVFLGNADGYWSAPFMYPEPETISYSDNLLGTSPIYFAFRLLGCTTYLSFQLWYMSLAVLNFITAALLFQFLLKDSRAAMTGAFIFAFSIALYSQIGHAQTFPRPAIPLTFLFLAKFYYSQSARHLFYSLLSLVFVFYSGIYLGFLVSLPVVLFFLFILIKILSTKKYPFFTKKQFALYLAAISINLILLLLLMIPYFGRRNHPSLYLFNQIKNSIPTFSSYLKSQYYFFQSDFLAQTRTEQLWPHQLFPGFFALALIILAAIFFILRKREKKQALNTVNFAFLISGFLSFIIYLRIGNLSLYQLIFHIPGFAAMRSLTRIINVEVLFLGFIAGWAVKQILVKNARWGNLIFIVILMLLAVDNHPKPVHYGRIPVKNMIEREQALDSLFAGIPEGSLISYEPDSLNDPPSFYHLDAMLLSQKYGLTTINAYTATCPGDYGSFWKNPERDGRIYWLADKNISFTNLYVIKNPKSIHLVNLREELKSYSPEEKYQDLLDQTRKSIERDSAWMESVRKTAIKKNISLDSAITKTAVWHLNQVQKKNGN